MLPGQWRSARTAFVGATDGYISEAPAPDDLAVHVTEVMRFGFAAGLDAGRFSSEDS